MNTAKEFKLNKVILSLLGEVSKKADNLNIICAAVIYNLDFSPLKSGSKWLIYMIFII